MAPQVLLVFGGKAAGWAFVRSQIGVHSHMSLGKISNTCCLLQFKKVDCYKNFISPFLNLKWNISDFVRALATLTSGHDVAVNSQSGHLNVLGSRCALLWFSMSERPWKVSMQTRQQKRLLLRKIGWEDELWAGDPGASLLSFKRKLYI